MILRLRGTYFDGDCSYCKPTTLNFKIDCYLETGIRLVKDSSLFLSLYLGAMLTLMLNSEHLYFYFYCMCWMLLQTAPACILMFYNAPSNILTVIKVKSQVCTACRHMQTGFIAKSCLYHIYPTLY